MKQIIGSFFCSGPTIFGEEENKKQLNSNDTFRMDDEMSTINVPFKIFHGKREKKIIEDPIDGYLMKDHDHP